MTSPPDGAPHRARSVSISIAGIAGTIVLAVLVVVFLRLGFWQLNRLAEVREVNRAVAARLDAPPAQLAAVLQDTAGSFYRTVEVSGRFDNQRSVILPGRSRRSLPGVYVLTPLLLDGRGEAVLVNRGWVPSPDAATVDLPALDETGPILLRALVLPFPGPEASLAPRPMEPAAGFRRVWYHVDERELRAQFPYPLANIMLQALPAAAAAGQPPRRYPQRLEPPPLTEGSHLGYALQWFSFALIGVIGWIALMLKSRQGNAQRAVATSLIILFVVPATSHAQLRPLDPLEWRIFEPHSRAIVEIGGGVFRDHVAPLAGTRGRLIEVGNYLVAFRSGRIAMEIRGTAVWRMHEERVEREPLPVVDPAPDGVRTEAGALHATSAVRVSPDAWPVDVFFRFGATVPTASDESGLERDRTDIFALAGFRYRRGALLLTSEQGVGINGSQSADYPQTDMWTFNLGAAWDLGPGRLVAELVGRQDGHSYVVPGNEDQHELRIGGDLGTDRWIGVRVVTGLSRYSPDAGLRIGAGVTFPRR